VQDIGGYKTVLGNELHPAFWISTVSDGVISGLFRGQRMQVFEDQVGPVPTCPKTGDLLNGEDAFELLDSARSNLLVALGPEALHGLPESAYDECALEICHLFGSSYRHASIAAAECEDTELQQILGKLAIHWSRQVPIWNDVANSIAGLGLDDLVSLPGTSALNLALEELACRDVLAYCAVPSVFGSPGHTEGVRRVSALVMRCCGEKVAPLLEKWASAVSSSAVSYSSIRSLQDLGHPYEGDLLRMATLRGNGRFVHEDLRNSIDRLRRIHEHFELFFFGLGHTNSTSREFPSRRINWLSR
jgi:hypothetical protein